MSIRTQNTIVTVCTNCSKESEVRGLDWSDLKVEKDKQVTITRTCANCRFREKQKGLPMKESEKQYRKQYNKNRNERIKIALEMLKQTEGTDV